MFAKWLVALSLVLGSWNLAWSQEFELDQTWAIEEITKEFYETLEIALDSLKFWESDEVETNHYVCSHIKEDNKPGDKIRFNSLKITGAEILENGKRQILLKNNLGEELKVSCSEN